MKRFFTAFGIISLLIFVSNGFAQIRVMNSYNQTPSTGISIQRSKLESKASVLKSKLEAIYALKKSLNDSLAKIEVKKNLNTPTNKSDTVLIEESTRPSLLSKLNTQQQEVQASVQNLNSQENDALLQLEDANTAIKNEAPSYKPPIQGPGTTEEAKVYWGEMDSTAVLNNVNISFNNESNSVYLEYFKKYVGPIRMSFGAVMSNTKDATPADSTVKTDKQTVNQFLAGGGNLSFALGWPMFGVLPDPNARLQWFNLIDFINARAGFDFKGMGTASSTTSNPTTSNVYLCDQLDILLNSDSKDFVFFTHGEYGEVWGAKSFYTAVGQTNAFQNASLSLGFNLYSKFSILYTHPIRFSGTPDLSSDQFTIQLAQLTGSTGNSDAKPK